MARTQPEVTTSVGEAPRPRHLPVAFTAVELADRLWAPRQRVVRERTVPFLYGQMEKIGTIEALEVTKPPGPLAFPYRKNNTSTSVMYWDSDIAKWIETASYTLATHRDPALDAPDRRHRGAHRQGAATGRLFQQLLPAPRARQEAGPTCATGMSSIALGHLIEAAVAHDQATGKTTLLDVVRRYADLHREAVRARAGPAARLLRPRGDRAGPGQALPR